MILSGAELLIRTLREHGTKIIFGYPGSCIMQVLDNLYRDRTIRHVLVRHEQGAVHAAAGYSQIAGRAGVVLVTSGPAGTNTLTGIADAFASATPLVVITGQVDSKSIGSDAFQEIDMISLSASITKWNAQIRQANQIKKAVDKAFEVACNGRHGPVLLDITKDAQSDRSEYLPSLVPKNIRSIHNNNAYTHRTLALETTIYGEIFKELNDREREVVWVLDPGTNDFFDKAFFEGNRILQSYPMSVPGFGLPAAIGASFATEKTVCLIVGAFEFQATIEELGVIRQEGITIKIAVWNNNQENAKEVKNPNFVKIAKAYGIDGERIKRERLTEGAEHMWSNQGSYLLEIEG